MRHRKNKANLNRFTSWRRATVIALSRSLLIHQSIRTTKTKAKAALPLAESLIKLGKRDNLASRRAAFSVLQDHKLVQLLFTEIAPRFSNRGSGFCRILPLGLRRGDNAKLVILELIEKSGKKKKPVKKQEVRLKPKEEAPKEIPAKPKVTPPSRTKPTRKFLGGLRKIFKKERDSL
jgi:large subunit ribosomal protein L17